jgi:hypothetical protein
VPQRVRRTDATRALGAAHRGTARLLTAIFPDLSEPPACALYCVCPQQKLGVRPIHHGPCNASDGGATTPAPGAATTTSDLGPTQAAGSQASHCRACRRPTTPRPPIESPR